MRIFVYEFLTGGGLFLEGQEPPSGSMLREGAAMLEAVAHDLSQLQSAEVTALWDARLGDPVPGPITWLPVAGAAAHQAGFDRLTRQAEFTLLIAPEIRGRLLALTSRAETLGACLLGPNSEFVRLASDKLATVARLQAAGVPVPVTFRCETRDDLRELPAGPLVRKPVDGAGSWRVSVTDRVELTRTWDGPGAVCVQAFCAGRPASVAALCGTATPLLLPPCWQHVEPPSFAYRGGELMTDASAIARAHRLARAALAALPAARGYVGIDLILADRGAGSDVVIEVNPRLTTSYIGLRQITVSNLAGAMWRRARGQEAELSFRTGPLQFEPAGRIAAAPRSS